MMKVIVAFRNFAYVPKTALTKGYKGTIIIIIIIIVFTVAFRSTSIYSTFVLILNVSEAAQSRILHL
jgi:flagellar basal body-associated protein FliL